MSSVTPADGGYKYYQQRISDLEDQLKDEAKRSEVRHEDQMNSLEQSYRSNIAKRDKETEETVNKIRDHSSELIASERSRAQSDVDRAKAETYDKFGRSNAEIEYHRKRADKAIQDTAEAYEKNHDKSSIASRAADEVHARNIEEKITKATETQIRAHENETRELRQQVHDVLDHAKIYDKEKGQALVDVRQEVENDHRLRERVMRNQYGAEIENLKRAMDNADNYHAQVAAAHDREKDAYHAGIIQKINQDQSARERELQANYQRGFNLQQESMKKQEQAHEQTLENQFKLQNDIRTAALESQAKTNQETLKRQKIEDQDQIQRLMAKIREQQMHEAGTLSDSSLEQQVYRQLTEKYQKLLNEEVQRNARKSESIQQNYNQDLTTIQRNGNTLLTQAQQQNATEAQRERSTFLNHVQDTEQNHQLALRNQEADTTRQSEAVRRTYSNLLDRQRRDYEDLLNQIRTDASSKLTALRQESDFNLKMAQRGFTSQQNDTIREYEKKMTEQKVGYEDAIEALRYQLSQHQREAERRTQQLLGEQNKAHEQKIAQMEFQTKERERTISQNYEDQIEKIKRSNALTIQKKG